MEINKEYARLIHRYLNGAATEAEKSTLAGWLEKSPSHKEYFASLSALFHASATLAGKAHTERMLSRLNARIDSEDDGIFSNTLRKRRNLKAVWIFAASVAAAFVVGIGTYLHVDGCGDDISGYSAYSNVSDDISAVMLDDSTKVWLSANSSILYNAAGSERIVKLAGEAYFDVHRDTARPFIVKTGAMDVRVLGTAFCVRNDEADGKVSVLLERGSVRLQSPEGTGLVRLSPDQMAEFDTKTGDISVTAMDAEPYIVRRYNKVTLQQVSVAGIIEHIERMYGIKVQAMSQVDTSKKYNLNYKRTDDVRELAETVRELTGVSLRIVCDANNEN